MNRQMSGFTMNRQTSGFTIVELLIVIVVIALLATLSMVGYGTVRQNATTSALNADASTLQKYIELEKLRGDGSYPTSVNLTLPSGKTYTYTASADRSTYCAAVSNGSLTRHVEPNSAVLEGNCVPIPQVVVSNGLLAWWTFNGNANDSSGNGYNGTLNNGVAPTNGQNGYPAGAYDFDGVNDYISYGDILNNRAYPISFSAWVYLKSSAVEAPVFITDNTEYYYGYRLTINTSRQVYTHYGSAGVSPDYRRSSWSPTGAIPLNQWVHITSVINGPTSHSVYINNVLQTGMTYSGSASSQAWSSDSATSGYLYNSSSQLYYANFRLDDLRVYDRALTPAEVSSLYAAGAQ